MRGRGAEAVLNLKRADFPGPQEAMLTSCALAVRRLYNAYVRKLFCVHLGRDVTPYLHAGWRGVIGTYEGRTHRWEP